MKLKEEQRRGKEGEKIWRKGNIKEKAEKRESRRDTYR
jgi:hypothetical protein